MRKFEESCVIHPEKGEIEFNDSLIALRPKTFELLLLLSSKPEEVFSRAKILENIWGQSVVEDQVVFQSINEIRKEFGSTDVIKTYPRRGYSWNYPDTVIISQDDKNGITNKLNFFSSKANAYLAFVLCLLLVTLVIFFNAQAPLSASGEQKNQIKTISSHAGILILPLNVEALQESEKWIRFGAVQGLINKISPSDEVTVFQLEDVIEILNRLSVQEKGDISKLFNRSGASVILKSSISGVPGDYHIVYSVFTPTSVETKSINVKTINAGINALAKVFDNMLTPVLNIGSKYINSQLQDNLITKAIQFLEVNDYQSALAFLKSAIVADKTNIYAHYLLAKIASRIGEFEQALDSTQTALKLINNGANEQYKNRILFTHGSVLLAKGSVEVATDVLLAAEEASKLNKDWLYFSYSQSMLGKAHQIKRNFSKAKLYFTSALRYQELLQCPMGVAQSHLNLAEFYLAQHQKDNAIVNIKLAESLIEEQKLQQAVPILAYLKDKFDQYKKEN